MEARTAEASEAGAKRSAGGTREGGNAVATVSAVGVDWVLHEHEERGTPGAVEMHTRDIPAGSIALLDSLLVVLLVVSQLGSTSAYKAKCSSDADFQYNGCSTVPC
jgi:hypothetical protein